MYKVLIVEDDPMARMLFELFVKESQNYQLIASIDNADLTDIYCLGEKIDLIIMDIRTAAYSNGLEASKRIKEKYPTIKIIIVTSMPEYSYLEKAKKIGVDSFWYKEVNKEPFYTLMDRTMEGEHIYPDTTPVVKIGNALSTEFTKRELEILKELTSGATNQMIADKLCITIRTVKAHITHLQEKTGFMNRTELAVKARESGLVINDE